MRGGLCSFFSLSDGWLHQQNTCGLANETGNGGCLMLDIRTEKFGKLARLLRVPLSCAGVEMILVCLYFSDGKRLS